MKKIEAIIRTTKFEDVKKALEEGGYVSLTRTEVRGRGQQKGITQQWRGAEYIVDMIPKTKIEIVISDEQVDSVTEIICASARTGEIGDGKIFILPIDDAIRIRTTEKGKDAI